MAAAKRNPVGKPELQSIVAAAIADADGQSNSEISNERGMAMDYYQARPFGNEMEGRSSVVSTDVRDTIEWILPTLIRIFCSGEDAVEFEPESEHDVAVAKQATEYVNFIWNRDNSGFVNFYSWFKDALLQKNGVLKIWWDDTPKTKRERYSGLDEMAFAWLVNDPSVEVSEHTENKTTQILPQPDPQDNTKTIMVPVEISTHDVVLTRKIPGGRVCIVPVPPEEFLISRDARTIAGAKFVGHRRRRTLSELVEEGYDQEQVESLIGSDSSIVQDTEAQKRDTVETDTAGTNTDTMNPAMRMIWVTEGYIKVDVDGDGIAEMRKVVVAGAQSELLSDMAWDTPRPFSSLTPCIMPHRFNGLSMADLIMDIQLIKSTIMRQYLDNLYLANNQREQVVEANIVDPSEVLSSAPGRKIRVKNGPAVFPIQVPDIGSQALAGLEYIDQIRENRTGVSPRTQGLGSNQLHQTASGEQMLMSQAMGKIELIARIFAETGVKDGFRLILKLICQYQDAPRTVRLSKEQWVTMDPTQWNSDMDMTVSVGLGVGDKAQQLQNAQLLGQMQQLVVPLGYVTPENMKNAAEVAINAMGFKGVDRFFTFPTGPAAQQPPQQQQKPDPVAQAKVQQTQAHIQNEQAKTASTIQLNAQQQRSATILQFEKQNAEAAQKTAQITAELALKNKEVMLGHIANLNEAAIRASEKENMPDIRPGGEPG